MIINSSELRGAGFNLQEVIPPELESAARLGRRTRGAVLRQLEGVGRKMVVLLADDDNELRSRCERVSAKVDIYMCTIQISCLRVFKTIYVVLLSFSRALLTVFHLKSGDFYKN